MMKAPHGEIPWRQIADFGNVLRHAYDRVDPAILWKVFEEDLPPLKSAIQEMYAKTKRDDDPWPGGPPNST